jgi:hypothetical protein
MSSRLPFLADPCLSCPSQLFPASFTTLPSRVPRPPFWRSCSGSSTLINSFESASLIPTSLIADNVVNSKTSMKPSVPTTALVPAGNTPAIAALSPDQHISQSSVVIITKTAWSTTWTSITAEPDTAFTIPAKASDSSAQGFSANHRSGVCETDLAANNYSCLAPDSCLDKLDDFMHFERHRFSWTRQNDVHKPWNLQRTPNSPHRSADLWNRRHQNPQGVPILSSDS